MENSHYKLLKSRMINGTPFLKNDAIERINDLADNFEITKAEAAELVDLANRYGKDVLPDDYKTRIDNLDIEQGHIKTEVDDINLVLADVIGGAI